MTTRRARTTLFQRLRKFFEGIQEAYSACSDFKAEIMFEENSDRIDKFKLSYKNLNGNPRVVYFYLIPCCSGVVGPDVLLGNTNGFKSAFVDEDGNQIEPYRRDHILISDIENPNEVKRYFNTVLQELLNRGIL